jgi:hypothetical protein
MTADERALLSAVEANPAADLPRLSGRSTASCGRGWWG